MNSENHDATTQSLIKLANKNWHLIPIAKGDKRPFLSNWGAKASCDPAQIEQWSEDFPQYNWGLLLGPKSGIIDLEDDTPEGREIFTAAMEACGVVTPCYSSGKSIHRLFQYDERFVGLTAITYQLFGCEFRFGVGGKAAQSVLPPSIHPSGATYAWLPGLSPEEVEVARLPDAMWNLFLDLRHRHDELKTQEREEAQAERKRKPVAPRAVACEGDFDSLVEAAEAAIESIPFATLLREEGWDSEDNEEWSRPGGGSNPKSASISCYQGGEERLMVWSNAAPILGGTSCGKSLYSRWRFWYTSNAFLDNEQHIAARAFLGEAEATKQDASTSADAFAEALRQQGGDDWEAKEREEVAAVQRRIEERIEERLQAEQEARDEEAEEGRYKPFPVDHLPAGLRELISSGAKAIGCDDSYIALPVLAVCASAIGGSRVLRIKETWKVPSSIWVMVIGESGTCKTPAFKIATAPVTARQQRLSRGNKEAVAQHKADLADWKKSKDGGEQPEPPSREVVSVSDTTIEALAPILQENPNGVLLQRDELSGWISSFGQYAKGSDSADSSKWLEIYSCSPININRKSTDAPNVSVDRPVVSICGGIQPGVYARQFGLEHQESGLQSRILVAYPPRVAKTWTDEDVDARVLAEYDRLVTQLYDHRQANGEQIEVSLSPKALRLFKEFVILNGQEQMQFEGTRASHWSKLEEIPARLALVFHCIETGTGVGTTEVKVSEGTMRRAIRVTEWFKAETLRLNKHASLNEDDRNRAALVLWIKEEHKGRVTVRELMRRRQSLAKNKATAVRLLSELVKEGFGSWEHEGKTELFILG